MSPISRVAFKNIKLVKKTIHYYITYEVVNILLLQSNVTLLNNNINIHDRARFVVHILHTL